MDTKLQVTIFREHSQHIRELSIKLEEALQQFAQVVSDPAGSAAAEARALLGEVRNLNNSLFAAADIFYQRLGKFIETRNIGGSSVSGE